jgi:hypothetical protein
MSVAAIALTGGSAFAVVNALLIRLSAPRRFASNTGVTE